MQNYKCYKVFKKKITLIFIYTFIKTPVRKERKQREVMTYEDAGPVL